MTTRERVRLLQDGERNRPQVDHAIPRSRGGQRYSRENGQTTVPLVQTNSKNNRGTIR